MKRIVREHMRREVLVTLKSGEAFGGVLFQADSEAVVLRNVTSLESGNGTDRRATPVDGELLILRPDIAYMQFA